LYGDGEADDIMATNPNCMLIIILQKVVFIVIVIWGAGGRGSSDEV
jgi:hypothetical protein